MTFVLHDYQQKLVDRTRQSYVDGYKAPCVVAPWAVESHHYR